MVHRAIRFSNSFWRIPFAFYSARYIILILPFPAVSHHLRKHFFIPLLNWGLARSTHKHAKASSMQWPFSVAAAEDRAH